MQLVSSVLLALKKMQDSLPKFKSEKFLHPVEDLQNYFSDNAKISLLGKGKMTEELMSEKDIYQESITVEPRLRGGESPKVPLTPPISAAYEFPLTSFFQISEDQEGTLTRNDEAVELAAHAGGHQEEGEEAVGSVQGLQGAGRRGAGRESAQQAGTSQIGYAANEDATAASLTTTAFAARDSGALAAASAIAAARTAAPHKLARAVARQRTDHNSGGASVR